MTRAAGAMLNDGTERLRQLLRACADGDLPPGLTLAHFLVETRSVEAASQLLSRVIDETPSDDERAASRIAEVERLLRQHRGEAARAVDMLGGVDHEFRAATPDEGIARFRAMFDLAVARSPEASVALHSLGSTQLLDEATAEIVGELRNWGLLGPSRRVLDIGCGIGRFERALAPEVGAIVGVDISANMIAEARRRCAGLPNVQLAETHGRDLGEFAAASFDLVLSVDVFPYVVQSGTPLVEAYFREIARVLAPGGDLVVLNFAYIGDVESDRRDVTRLADANGFDVVRNGTSDFRLWDGVSFVLKSRSPFDVFTNKNW